MPNSTNTIPSLLRTHERKIMVVNNDDLNAKTRVTLFEPVANDISGYIVWFGPVVDEWINNDAEVLPSQEVINYMMDYINSQTLKPFYVRERNSDMSFNGLKSRVIDDADKLTKFISQTVEAADDKSYAKKVIICLFGEYILGGETEINKYLTEGNMLVTERYAHLDR